MATPPFSSFTPVPDPMTSRPAVREMRRQLMIMIASVLVLDAAAIGIYQFAGIRTAEPRFQYVFVGAWTLLTLLLVLRGTGRVRAARLRDRRE